MSINPFDQITERLERIEKELLEIKAGLHAESRTPDEKPLTVKELAAFLGVTVPTLIRYRAKGQIPFMKIGSRILFNKSAVLKALEVNKYLKAARAIVKGLDNIKSMTKPIK